jgi:protein-disulfide isomerase
MVTPSHDLAAFVNGASPDTSMVTSGFGLGGPYTAPIVIDKFADLLCPDCAASWPVTKQVIAHYGSATFILC